MEWKDTTSYRRGETIEPNSFTFQTKSLRVIVHKYQSDAWVLSCYDLKIECRTLNTASLQEAKDAALKIIQDKLETLLKEITG
jgi:hypothetical protein